MPENKMNDTMTFEQRISFFHALINCENTIPMWVYNSEFHLASATSERLVLHTIFEHTGNLEYMKTYFRDHDKPLILSSFLGLMWCAAKAPLGYNDRYNYYVIGPVFNAEISLDSLREAAERYHVDPTWRQGFIKTLYCLSTVPSSTFFQYALMIHYSITQEYISINDIGFQHSNEFDDKTATHFKEDEEPVKDRSTTYYMETRLLNNIRNGNTNYSNDMLNARKLSRGIRVMSKDPINQAILSCSTFISLCTRAAIEGGLSPDKAYTIGDGYIQVLIGCRNITDLRTVTHKMYDEFIHQVRMKKEENQYSKQIQGCIDYMNTHLFDNITLHDLADYAGYTDYYLSHKFRQETGMTVAKYMNKLKLDEASDLLRLTTDPIASIAEKLHFCSSSYFSAQFKKQFGMLPQQYRDINQNL